MSSVLTYLFAFFLLIAGLALGAAMLGVPTLWIGIGGAVLLGVAILAAFARSRKAEPPS